MFVDLYAGDYLIVPDRLLLQIDCVVSAAGMRVKLSQHHS